MTKTGLFRLIVSFQDAHGYPLSGADYKVRVYDHDLIHDDFLGEGNLDDNGIAELLISVADISSLDSIGERMPDLFFVLMQDGKRIYRTDTITDVDFEPTDPVTGREQQLTREFGPFRAPV